MLDVDDRVIMISGANRGIGLAVATRLSQQGFRLSLGARDPAKINASALGANVMTHRWDATDAASATAWAEATTAKFSRIDGVVLNAGIVIRAGLESGSEADIDAMWEVNFKGPLRVIRAALPALKTSGHGRVVNIVSLAGKRLLRDEMLGYSASKFSAAALTHAVRYAGWENGIRATSICPGMVDTDMVADMKVPQTEFKIAPETIAETVSYALSLPNNAVVAEILVNSRLESMF